ncbi:hypothetical protein O181_013825 [Austropuccinia psidii MF-1]|uniref:Heme haloperoxidase family profile domain-containing protein n=1 Tax=Austropuccinia psidii MF-1 TaxID=1389203 RepID=A0A9Q3BZT9_9BASI|nr:hypothetical protein [Austropuccinia psidii MF-1]
MTNSLAFESGETNQSNSSTHPYHRRKLGCPCPALSILINHNYLTPKDEYTQIKLTELINALLECFNLGRAHAFILSITACLICGNGLSVSIFQLGAHGRLEHDASITRLDKAEGDYLNPNKCLIERFLGASADPARITLDDYALRRAELEAQTPCGLSWIVKFIAYGEVGLTIGVFGHRGPRWIESKKLRTVFLEERLPDGWIRPENPLGMFEVLKIAYNLNKNMKIYASNNLNQEIPDGFEEKPDGDGISTE